LFVSAPWGNLLARKFSRRYYVIHGVQNPGKLTINNVVRDTELEAFSVRGSLGGQVIGFEQTLAYSPSFLNPASEHSICNPIARWNSGWACCTLRYRWRWLITTFGDSFFNFGDIGTKFAFNYGGGIKLRNLAGPLGVRFDIRGYSVPGVFSQTLNFVEGSVGVLFSF
jgi:hypothetical protein